MVPLPTGVRIPSSVWALGFVSLLMDISSEMIHSLLPAFLITSLGASAFAVGLIEGTAEATALIMKVFSGALSDFWGKRKPLALLGYGLGAGAKPLFAIATNSELVFTARLIDRMGKGIRGAPRDALVADLVPPGLRGTAFGLRQSLDTVGAFLGPLLAMALMLLWNNDFRAVFGIAVIPGFLAVAVLFFGVREPVKHTREQPVNPLRRGQLARLSRAFWWVVAIGALLALARFSEAFLILRALQGGLSVAFAPLVLICMNLVYAATAYPFGKLSDRLHHTRLLTAGIVVLIGADGVLAYSGQSLWVWLGILLWGLHMGITQGLLATMVADTTPANLRGTAYGFFNLLSGLVMLAANAIAGLLWDHFGPPQTFIAGALFSGIALLVIGCRMRAAP
jgi:MFS family permease